MMLHEYLAHEMIRERLRNRPTAHRVSVQHPRVLRRLPFLRGVVLPHLLP